MAGGLRNGDLRYSQIGHMIDRQLLGLATLDQQRPRVSHICSEQLLGAVHGVDQGDDPRGSTLAPSYPPLPSFILYLAPTHMRIGMV